MAVSKILDLFFLNILLLQLDFLFFAYRNMYDATFQILRDSRSLELAVASYQLLIELDKVSYFMLSSLRFHYLWQ